MSVATGSRLGAYEITGKLGEGGMGEVWRATDSRLKREVAIKVLPAEFTADRERLARFEREAQLLAQLHHPNIASIFGLEEQDGVRALVMELVLGEDLSVVLGRGALPVEDAIRVARQIAAALEAAHEKGIVHRDLKPANVKLAPDGAVKVLDFGLAKAMDAAASGAGSPADLARSPTLMHSPTLTAAHGTQLGVILGTAAYMAPEQAKGRPVDRRADIWAFGVLLHEMLTGRRLFAGDSVAETLAAVLRQDPEVAALPPNTPAAVRELVRRCLVRDPQQRLQSIGDARVVLEEAAAAGDLADGAASRAPSARLVGATLGGAWRLVAAIVVAALAGALVSAWWTTRHAVAGERPAAFRFQKVTDMPGVEWGPEIAADGRTLFFSRSEDGGNASHLYTVPVGGKKPLQLTTGPWYDGPPRLSPDGTRLAFASSRDGGGIFLVGVNGESLRRLTAAGNTPAWSPDGRSIVFSTEGFDQPWDRGAQGKLRLVDVASGAERELRTSVPDAMQPAWSPSGKRIAFWGLRDRTGNRELWTVAAGGGAAVDVASDPALDWNPVWSADGTHLYFLSNRGGTMNLWRVPIDETSGRVLGPAESVPLPAEEVSRLARTGNHWVYGALSFRTKVERLDFDPVHATIGSAPAREVFTATTILQSLSPSPDGKLLAYSTVIPQQDVFVVDSGGGTSTQLTDDPARDRMVSWSPDGKEILFMSSRAERYEIWSIHPDGSGLRRLTRTKQEEGWTPRLSPNADRLAVNTAQGAGIFDARQPPPWSRYEPLPAIPGGAKFAELAWSPDGMRLAGFAQQDAQRGRLAVFDFASRSYRVLEQPSGPVGWFPDGRRLLAQVEGMLAVLDLATWQLSPVAGGPERNGVVVSPDLRTLYVTTEDDQEDIWLAQEAPRNP